MNRSRWGFGPGFLVTAAFIGPGTVVTASKMGAEFQYALVWALGFAVVATIILQEMSARLAIVGQQGLAEAIRSSLPNRGIRFLSLTLVILAILFGNCAFQAGNLAGAGAGIGVIAGGNASIWISLIALTVLILIWIGQFKVIQNFLTCLVMFMSLLFIAAAIISRPDWSRISSGLIPTSLPTDAWFKVIALIGTTIVPYNLFLHASAALEKWPAGANQTAEERQSILRSSRWDTLLSVAFGGLITLAIMITAAEAFAGKNITINQPGEIAEQLKPALGSLAQIAFAAGLFAAGLTSALTAPIAAAYAAAGAFGVPAKLSDVRLKLVATGVVLVGLLVNLTISKSPTEVILTAQIANGILLPLIVFFLLFVVNNSKIMGIHRNRMVGNILGGLVLIVILAITLGQTNSIYSRIKSMVQPKVTSSALVDGMQVHSCSSAPGVF